MFCTSKKLIRFSVAGLLVIATTFACKKPSVKNQRTANHSGAVVFTVSSDYEYDNSTLTGYAVGAATSSTFESNENGTFCISGIPTGTSRQILLTATATNAASLVEESISVTLGSLKDIADISNGEMKDIGEITLQIAGQVTGTASRVDIADRTGINVSLGGTLIAAETIADGTFTIEGVPPGVYGNDESSNALETSRFGYSTVATDKLTVSRNGIVSIDENTEISPFSIGEGQYLIYPQSTHFVSGSLITVKDVIFDVFPLENAVEFMASMDNDFENCEWETLATTWSKTLVAGGNINGYIKYKDSKETESPIFAGPFDFDPFSEDGNIFTPTFTVSTSEITPPEVSVTLSNITAPTGATKMVISINSDYDGEDWVEIADSATYSVPKKLSSCATTTIFLRFKNSEDLVSAPGTQEFTVKCFQDAPTTNAPIARSGHTSTSTGSQVLVWGGETATEYTNSGALYNISTSSWSSVTETNAPAGRKGHTAVTDGSAVYVWGGEDSGGVRSDGGYFNGTAWVSLETTGTPLGRTGHTAVWDNVNDRMIIWGGFYSPLSVTERGKKWDLAGDSWTSVSDTGAPSDRKNHTAVWSGTEMIIWGGYTTSGAEANGAKYNPSSDSWTAITTTGAPAARYMHSAVWNSVTSKMVVYGGLADSFEYATGGGIYDPQSDSWTTFDGPTTGATGLWIRRGWGAVFQNSKMWLFGGYGKVTVEGTATSSILGDGISFDPATSSWEPMSTVNAPSARRFHSISNWTNGGTKGFFIWGGSDDDGLLATGAVFNTWD